MNLIDIQIGFTKGERPRVVVRFDKAIVQELASEPEYEARYARESNLWVYRADCGAFVSCGVEFNGHGNAKLRMVDGVHNIHGLHQTNGPAVNALFHNREPVMDVWADESHIEVDGVKDPKRILPAHVNAILFAKYLYVGGADVALAVVEWPEGVRVYEPVRIVEGEPLINRPQDRFIFVARPDRPTIMVEDAANENNFVRGVDTAPKG